MKRVVILAAVLALAGQEAPAATETAPQFMAAALAAHGGAAALNPDATLVVRGNVSLQMGPASVQGELTRTRAGKEKLRTVTRATFRGTPSEFITALDGPRAWSSRMGRTFDQPPTNMRIELAHDLDIVARAAAPGAQLSDQGEVVSGQRTLRKFELNEAGQTTRLLFDPQTHLLAELEYRAAQNDGMGETKEVATRKVYSDYRPAAGFPYPHTLTQYRDGVQALELTVTSVERGAKVDPAQFRKPEEEDDRLYSEEFAN